MQTHEKVLLAEIIEVRVVRVGRDTIKVKHERSNAPVIVEADFRELSGEIVTAPVEIIGRLDASRVDRNQGFHASAVFWLFRMFEQIYEKTSSLVGREIARNLVEFVETVINGQIDNKVYVDFPPEQLQTFSDS